MWTTRTQSVGMVWRDKTQGSEPNRKKGVSFLEHELPPLCDGNPQMGRGVTSSQTHYRMVSLAAMLRNSKADRPPGKQN